MRHRAVLVVLATVCALCATGLPASAQPGASGTSGVTEATGRSDLTATTTGVAAGTASASASKLDVAPLYLALGDSVAYGIGAVIPPTGGYVARLHSRLLRRLTCWPAGWPLDLAGCPPLWRDNVAVPGATTVDVIRDQLPSVTAELRARNSDGFPFNDVRAVTVTAGGNDVFGPVLRACAEPSAPTCAPTVAAQLQQVATNLSDILRQLALAAGDGTPIAVMTYYNPLGSCDLAALTDLATVVLEGGSLGADGAALTAGLNDVIRQAAQEAGAVVVDTYGALSAEDFVGGPDCLHPDDSGHAVIADAFADAVVEG